MTTPADRVPDALQDLDAQSLDDTSAILAAIAATTTQPAIATALTAFATDLQRAADQLRPRRTER